MDNFFELKHVNGEEATITELQDAMAKGELSSRELVMYYLYRIAQYDQNGPNALEKYGLDAILIPAYVGSDISAKAGYPSIAVPAGYKEDGRPNGITFAGTAFSEPTLIRIAYSFEQQTQHRRKPNMS